MYAQLKLWVQKLDKPQLMINLTGLALSLFLGWLVLVGLSCADYTPIFPELKALGLKYKLC